MAEDIRHFKLGLFFLLSIGLTAAGIIFLGVMDYFQPTYTIETYFVDESLSGLDVGSPVKLSGVTQGKVTKIETAGLVYQKNEIVEALNAGNLAKLSDLSLKRAKIVQMEIVPEQGLQDLEELREDLFEALVDAGLRARLSQSGITGPMFVNLVFVDPELNPVPELPWKPRHIYVPSAPSAISKLADSLSSMVTRLAEVDFNKAAQKLEQIFMALDDIRENIDIDEIRNNIAALAEDIRYYVGRLKGLIDDPRLEQALIDMAETASGTLKILKDRGENLGMALETIPRAVVHMEEVAARTEQLLKDERVDQIFEDVSTVAGNAGKTMENAEATTVELRRLVRELNRLTLIFSEDLTVITENLRRITEDAEIITGEIRDNPSRLLFGKEPPRLNPGETNEADK